MWWTSTHSLRTCCSPCWAHPSSRCLRSCFFLLHFFLWSLLKCHLPWPLEHSVPPLLYPALSPPLELSTIFWNTYILASPPLFSFSSLEKGSNLRAKPLVCFEDCCTSSTWVCLAHRRGLSRLAQATITKCHRPGDLNNRNVRSHGSGGWQSKIKVPAVSVSGDSPLPSLQMATSSLTFITPLQALYLYVQSPWGVKAGTLTKNLGRGPSSAHNSVQQMPIEWMEGAKWVMWSWLRGP